MRISQCIMTFLSIIFTKTIIAIENILVILVINANIPGHLLLVVVPSQVNRLKMPKNQLVPHQEISNQKLK